MDWTTFSTFDIDTFIWGLVSADTNMIKKTWIYSLILNYFKKHKHK